MSLKDQENSYQTSMTISKDTSKEATEVYVQNPMKEKENKNHGTRHKSKPNIELRQFLLSQESSIKFHGDRHSVEEQDLFFQNPSSVISQRQSIPQQTTQPEQKKRDASKKRARTPF